MTAKAVIAGGDDGYVNAGTSTFYGTANNIAMGYEATQHLHGFVGFDGVDIDERGVVDTMAIDFVAHSTSVATCPTLRIYGVLGQTVPTSYAEFTALSLTTGYVTWSDEPQWSGGLHYTTPDLSTVASEITTHASWTNPGKMIFVIKDYSSTTGIARYGASYEHTSYDPPHIDYTWHPGVPKIYVKTGGVWHEASGLYVKAGDTWRDVTAAYVKAGDVWRQVT